jgi:hypothetical protein
MLQKEIISTLAKIEEEDSNTCASCGGEDCICCSIYLDRKRWVDSEQLFNEMGDCC